MACAPLPAEPGTASEAGPCAKFKKENELHACFKREYTAADHTLNAVYKKIQSSIHADLRGDLRDNSREWIRMKEYNCGFQVEMLQDATEDRKRAEFYQCALGYTVSRTAYIRKAFGRQGVSAALAGDYDDGFSGNLELRKTPGEKNSFDFKIEVVRGPTYHLGEINGRVVFENGATGVYEERPNCSGVKEAAFAPDSESNEPCCRLDFQLRERQGFRTIEVKETDCGYFHGARAYFDGLYRKIK